MKKMFPLKGYFARARVFGYMLGFLLLFSLLYFIYSLIGV
jgi:hypothetical protein